MFCQYGLVILSVITGACGLTGLDAATRFFEYFEKDRPVGIPVLNLEEPADIFSPLDVPPITLWNATMLGHSAVFIDQVILNFVTLTGEINMTAPYLEINGNYSWPSVFDSSEGMSNTTLVNATIHSNFTLHIDQTEALQLEGIDIDIEYDDIYIDMTDLLWEQELLLDSGVVHNFFNPIFKIIFQQFEPFLLGEINRELNNFVSTLPQIGHSGRLMNNTGNFSTPEYQKKALPIFFRRIFNFLKLDPIQVPSKNFNLVGVKILFSEGILHGVSHIKAIDRLYMIYKDKLFYIESLMTYHQFQLFYKLRINAGGLSKFDISERVRLNDVKLHIKMTIDPSLKNSPKILHLGIDVGSFGEIRRGRKRHFLQKMFKDLFDKSKNEIVKALAQPVRKIVQRDLDQLDLKEEALNFLRSQKST